jgi:nitrogen fixation protein FixH
MNRPESRPGRNPWPAGIVIAFVVFVAGTAGLVVFSASQRVELVAPDYYEQELRYQQQIDRQARTRALGEAVTLEYNQDRRELQIQLPGSHGGKSASGAIDLYRPDARTLDRSLKLEVDAQGRQVIDGLELRPGLWRLRLSWAVGDQTYYWERKLVVPGGRG